jgi:Tol biopolymer transport system component/imidazolonepropionase-like amidohydrolase
MRKHLKRSIVNAVHIARTALICVLAVQCTQGDARSSNGRPDDRTIAFTVTEGTHMSLDVSPDGKTILFDLLGHIYTLPIDGGEAKVITSGHAWTQTPRYSPDGKQIAVVRDGDGKNELWLMSSDGGSLRQLTWDTSYSRVIGTPVWTHDGKAILYTIGNGNPATLAFVYRYDTASRATTQVTRYEGLKYPDYRAQTDPALAPGDTSLYVSELRLKHDPALDQRVIVRHNLKSGEQTTLTTPEVGVHHLTPQVSRDGRWLAFLRSSSIGTPTLYVRDLASGAERKLVAFPQSEVRNFSGFEQGGLTEHSSYAFTPDNRFIVISYDGHIYKVPVAGGEPTLVPFTVNYSRSARPLVRPRTSLPDGPFEAHAISWPRLSADKKLVVFSAIGSLWIQELAEGTPKRLTTASNDHFEYMPALSPDGKRVAYIDFERVGTKGGPGRLMVASLSDGSTTSAISEVQAADHNYLNPIWSGDGTKIAFAREEKDKTSFGWVGVDDGKVHVIASDPLTDARQSWSRLAFFSSDGKDLLIALVPKVYSVSEIRVVPLQGGEPRTIFSGGRDTYVGVMPSPDRKYAVITGTDQELWLKELSAVGTTALPTFDDSTLRRISDTGVEYLDWRSDRSFTYSIANKIYEYTIGDEKPKLIHAIHLTVPRKEGVGVTALKNARIITMNGNRDAGEVIEHGTIVVRGRRIVAVGPSDKVTIPGDARVIDATGLTLMPGLGDMHYHSGEWGDYRGMLMRMSAPYNDIGYPQGLAYGVTFGWEANKFDRGVSSFAELREAGRAPGPRWFGGASINSAESSESNRLMGSYEDALRSVDHKRETGTILIKEYLTSRRDRRRWMADAAREVGIGIASHATSLPWAMALAADGYTGFDHPNESWPVREDVRQFLARTGTIWSPDLFNFMSHGEFLKEVFQRWPVQRGKILNYRPESRRLGRADSSKVTFETDVMVPQVRMAAWLMAGGAKIGIAKHAGEDFQTHGELWALQKAGAKPGDILRAGTMVSAERLGLERELGSLEVGKIADILVLTANPLEDVMNTMALKYVIADGVLYDVSNPKGIHETVAEKAR